MRSSATCLPVFSRPKKSRFKPRPVSELRKPYAEDPFLIGREAPPRPKMVSFGFRWSRRRRCRIKYICRILMSGVCFPRPLRTGVGALCGQPHVQLTRCQGSVPHHTGSIPAAAVVAPVLVLACFRVKGLGFRVQGLGFRV